MKVERVTAVEVRPLRHIVLRPHQPIEECTYEADDEPNTGHYVAYRGDERVGAASIFQQSDVGEDPAAWRIRGMVSLEEVRGEGYGGALLEACLRHAAEHGGNRVWCNGRTTVTGFYEHFGFVIKGDEFEIPGLGPHVVMERAV